MFTIINNARCRRLVGGFKFNEVCYSGESVAQFGIDEFGRLWSWGNNYLGIGGLGNWEWHRSANTVYNRDNERILTPRLCLSREAFGEDKFTKTDFVQVQSGEGTSMALDSQGRLWCAGQAQWGGEVTEHNCAKFGLPHDSGEDDQEWIDGFTPRDNWKYYFFHFTRAVPGVTVKDYMHNSYYTLLIGQDDRVYYLGNDTYAISGNYPGTFHASEPALITQLDFPVKKLFHNGCFNYDVAGCITQDNRLIVWGSGVGWLVEFWDPAHDPETNNFIDITDGLPDEEIVDFSICWEGFLATLANGEVWRVESWDTPYQWERIEALPPMQWYRHSQNAMYGLDLDGYLWTERADYGTLLEWPNYAYEPTQSETKWKWKTVRYNRYNVCWQGVDVYGRLLTWGRQSWGPHLGNGTIGNLAWLASSYSGLTQEVYGEMWESFFPQSARYDAGEMIVNDIYDILFAAVPRPYER